MRCVCCDAETDTRYRKEPLCSDCFNVIKETIIETRTIHDYKYGPERPLKNTPEV